MLATSDFHERTVSPVLLDVSTRQEVSAGRAGGIGGEL